MKSWFQCHFSPIACWGLCNNVALVVNNTLAVVLFNQINFTDQDLSAYDENRKFIILQLHDTFVHFCGSALKLRSKPNEWQSEASVMMFWSLHLLPSFSNWWYIKAVTTKSFCFLSHRLFPLLGESHKEAGRSNEVCYKKFTLAPLNPLLWKLQSI